MHNNSSAPKIFLVGGGGHANSCIDVILSHGHFEIAGFTDQYKNAAISSFGYPYLGNDDQFEELIKLGFCAAICLGQIKNVDLRVNIYEKLYRCNAHLPVIKASTSYVSESATLGEGTMVFHNSVVNVGAKIGANCIINTSAIIEHGCYIGAHTHIAPHATILGDASIGESCFIGANAIIFPSVKIPSNSVISAGAIIKESPIN